MSKGLHSLQVLLFSIRQLFHLGIGEDARCYGNADMVAGPVLHTAVIGAWAPRLVNDPLNRPVQLIRCSTYV